MQIRNRVTQRNHLRVKRRKLIASEQFKDKQGYHLKLSKQKS